MILSRPLGALYIPRILRMKTCCGEMASNAPSPPSDSHFVVALPTGEGEVCHQKMPLETIAARGRLLRPAVGSPLHKAAESTAPASPAMRRTMLELARGKEGK